MATTFLESLGLTPAHNIAVGDMQLNPSNYGIENQFDYAAESAKDMVSRAAPGNVLTSAIGNVVGRPVYDFVDASKEYSKKGYQGEFSFTPQGAIDFTKNVGALGTEFLDQRPFTMMAGATKGGLEALKNRFFRKKRMDKIATQKGIAQVAMQQKIKAAEAAAAAQGPQGGGTWVGGAPAYTYQGQGGGEYRDTLGNIDYHDPYDPGGGEAHGGLMRTHSRGRTGFQGGGPGDWGQQERREGPYSESNMSQREYNRLQQISPSGGGGGDGQVVYGEHLKGLIDPPDRKDRRVVYGPFPPKGSRLGEPMFNTTQQYINYGKYLKQKEEEEERKRKDEEIAKTLSEMWRHDPGFEGKVGPLNIGINYDPEDPLETYTIDAGLNIGPASVGYSTGAELDDRYSLGVGFPTGGIGLLKDEATGDIMGGGQISTGPYTIEGGYGTGGPEWALGVNINKPFSSRGLLKKRPKKVPAPYARGGILGAF